MAGSISDPRDLRTGFIQGKFRLERLVGAGGMGVVYLAIDMVLDRQVAIKTFPTLRTESVKKLHHEARTLGMSRTLLVLS